MSDTVTPNHTPDHTFVCGGCGASTNDVETGHPLCVTGDAEHLYPPKLGFPLEEWAAHAQHGIGREAHLSFLDKLAAAAKQPAAASVAGAARRR